MASAAPAAGRVWCSGAAQPATSHSTPGRRARVERRRSCTFMRIPSGGFEGPIGPRAPAGRILPPALEVGLPGLLAEAHEPIVADAQGWGAQVAARAQDLAGELRERRPAVSVDVEDHAQLSAGRDDPPGISGAEEPLEVPGAEALLACVDRLPDGDPALRQEGIGARAARSRLAVVVPVDLGIGHGPNVARSRSGGSPAVADGGRRQRGPGAGRPGPAEKGADDPSSRSRFWAFFGPGSDRGRGVLQSRSPVGPRPDPRR
jgi:hypothetical protein